MKKIIIIITLLFSILAVNITASADQNDKMVKVGLLYDNKALTSIRLDSRYGINLSYNRNSYYIGSEGNFLSNNTYFAVNGEYTNYSEAKINATNGKHILVSDKYYVVTDNFITLESAKAAGNGKTFSGNIITLFADNDNDKLSFDTSISYIEAINSSVIANSDIIDNENIIKYNYNGNESYYRGNVILKIASNGLITVINHVYLEDYLKGVVPSEMPYSWDAEALKAQAVAARCYAYNQLETENLAGFHVSPTTSSQVYKGYTKEEPSTNAAVEDTKGVVATYNENVISAYFSSSSGGYTAGNSEVWNSSTNLPYLQPVKDDYSLGQINADWTLSYTFEEFGILMNNNGYDLGKITAVNILEKSVSGRAAKVEVVGDKASHIFEKQSLRAVVGSTKLRSMLFDINNTSAKPLSLITSDGVSTVDNPNKLTLITSSGIVEIVDSKNINLITSNGVEIVESEPVMNDIVFNGHGFGHGVGLSQYGAKGMAEAGKNYEEILKFYYTDIEVKKLY